MVKGSQMNRSGIRTTRKTLLLLLPLLAALALLAAVLPDLVRADAVDERPSNLGYELESGGIRISWDPPASDSASVTGYQILRRRPLNGEGKLLVLVDDTGSTVTNFLDVTANQVGVRYVYRVKALRDQVSSGRSRYIRIDLNSPLPQAQPATQTTSEPQSGPDENQPEPVEPSEVLRNHEVGHSDQDADPAPAVVARPPPPENMSYEYDSERIVLTWEHPDERSDVESYQLEERIFGTDQTRMIPLSKSTTRWTHSSPTKGQRYWYILRSVDAGDNLSWGHAGILFSYGPQTSYTFGSSVTAAPSAHLELWHDGEYTITIRAQDAGGDAPDDATFSVYVLSRSEFTRNSAGALEFQHRRLSTREYLPNGKDRPVPGPGNTAVFEGTMDHSTSDSVISVWQLILSVDDPGLTKTVIRVVDSVDENGETVVDENGDPVPVNVNVEVSTTQPTTSITMTYKE